LIAASKRLPRGFPDQPVGVFFPERIIALLRIRLLAGLLLLGLTAGCKAQIAPQNDANSALDRRIEIMVRSEFELPANVTVSLGVRGPSQFAGYETLPVTLSVGKTTQVVDLLISADSTKLVKLDIMDLTKDPTGSIDLTGRPIRGNPAAKVTIINFDDLECPFCARMNEELFPATMNRYRDQVRLIYKDYPLTELHPWAMHAAVNADCLAAQSGSVYWNYVDYLHAHGDEISGPDRNLQKSFEALDRIARQEGALGKLDEGSLNACIAKQDETAVRASLKETLALGLNGAPALFVNGERIDGAIPQDQIWTVIDRALRDAGEQPPPPEAPAPAQTAEANK